MKNNNIQISASEFKKHFLNLVDQVKNKHDSFIITKRNLPIASPSAKTLKNITCVTNFQK
ncbi:type II toxin-antitoxin system Phd/YefM family antitoxin [Rickettsia endosymbiont of Urophora cardui]|uniref:type II toxin-antitoxin system Phd/YefM family antitoxin n=1 Tax=Rickettsia endosymbiont of Urophora cardui TaxID=3066265 RepID=UPI00313EDDDD